MLDQLEPEIANNLLQFIWVPQTERAPLVVVVVVVVKIHTNAPRVTKKSRQDFTRQRSFMTMSSLLGSMISNGAADASEGEKTNFDIVAITSVASVGAHLRIFLRDALVGLLKWSLTREWLRSDR